MPNSIHRLLLLLALVLAIPTGVHGQNSRSHPLAVLPFVERGKETKDLGPKVTALLVAKLASDPAIVLVERDREDFRKVLDETQLGLSGLVDSEQAASVGQLTGARLLVAGSIMQVDATLHVVAKIISTETGRVLGAQAHANAQDDLSGLVSDLSKQVIDAVRTRGDDLVATAPNFEDRLAALKEKLNHKKLDQDQLDHEKLNNARRPTVFVQISKRPGCPATDAAAETELMLFCRELGFPVIDRRTGSKDAADVLILGEATSVVALRHGTLISAKVRLDVTAVDRKSRLVLVVDRQTARAVDLNEQLAEKSALQQAAATIAARMLPKLAQGVDF